MVTGLKPGENETKHQAPGGKLQRPAPGTAHQRQVQRTKNQVPSTKYKPPSTKHQVLSTKHKLLPRTSLSGHSYAKLWSLSCFRKSNYLGFGRLCQKSARLLSLRSQSLSFRSFSFPSPAHSAARSIPTRSLTHASSRSPDQPSNAAPSSSATA